MNNVEQAGVTPISKLNKALIKSLYKSTPGGVTDNEARFLVDTYYTIQKARIRNVLQVKSLIRDADKRGNEPEPHDHLDYFASDFATQEENIKKVLDYYVSNHPMGWFFDKTLGVGPVLAAGLLAFIDIHKAPTAGHIYSFAGLDPRVIWEKGKKRPWNASLKTICWKIGDSFVKTSGREDSPYGQMYRKRKALEWERNIAGEYVQQAHESMAKKKYGKATDQFSWYTGQCSPEKVIEALQAGKSPTAASCQVETGGLPMLSPAHIDARARRYVVKMFLSHLHECWYREEFNQDPPRPYAIAIMNHAHYVPPPQLAA